MNNLVFGRAVENVRKHRDIKLLRTERRRNYLVSEPSYYTTKFFTEHVLAIDTRKTGILLNKPVCLVLSILELNKILMYEFWYDFVKPKYGEKAKLCYMDTDSFIAFKKQMILIKTLQKMLKLDLILQIKGKDKKSYWVNER